jgi:hypothetical protein
MANVLVTSQYVLPGSYLGRIYTPNAGSLSGDPRQPSFVGKGSRLATALNIPIRRSFREGVQLSFPNTVPHLVTLVDPADGDQTLATMTTQSGTVIPASKWTFQKSAPNIQGYDQVLLLPEAFNATSTYYLDYQSIRRDVIDELPFDEIRQVVRVGDYQDQDYYQEQVDFYIRTSKTNPVVDTVTTTTPAFTVLTQTATGGGAATPSVAVAAGYTGLHNRHYRLEVVAPALPGPNPTFLISATNEGGGNALEPDYPTGPSIAALGSGLTLTPGVAGDYDLDLALGLPSQGVLVTIDPADVGNWATGDVFEFNALAPALIELDPAYDNTNQYSEVSAITPTLAVGSTGSITVNPNTNFTGTSNQTIKFECAAVVGALPGARQATIDWQMYGADGIQKGSFIASDIAPGINLTNIAIADGISVDVSFGATQFVPTTGVLQGDLFTMTATAPFIYYTGKDDREYNLTVSAAAATPSTAITGATAGVGGPFVVAGDLSATITPALSPVIRAVGAPAAFPGNTNDGVYTVVSSSYDSGLNETSIVVAENVPAGGAGGTLYYWSGVSSIFWSTATPEGGFGTIANMTNDTVSPLADEIKFYVRNSGNPLLYPDVLNNRNTANDVWTFTVTNEDEIVWDLVSRVTETVAVADLRQDVTGAITGVSGGGPGTRYIILEQTPTEEPLRIWTTATGGATTELTVDTTPPYVGGSDAYWIDGTPYIFFPTAPTDPVSVTYQHRAQEPDPGQVYYLTAYYLRPESMYNNPIRLLNEDDAISVLGPAAPDNDLLIMAQIALVDCDAFAVWVTQVRDTDDDGVFTTFDFNQAIEATELNDQLTDITVLQKFDALSKLKTSTIRMNDPFERKERLAWIGAPIGTEIGDMDTPDTLVFLAKRTLQVFGESPAHGAFILVGNTVCERTIELAEGTQVTVTLDGSFIAGAASALQGSFSDPAETLLRKTQPGFDRIGGTTIDVQYQEKELKILGAAGISTLQDQGASTYLWVEDITVDTFAQDTQQINAMTQKQFVTRYIRSRMDVSITGIVAPSQQAGVAIVQGFLVELLRSLGSRGIIGPWTDDNGNERDIDPTQDVEVFRDETDRTLYHYKFWFNIRYPVKRTFGLFSVDSRAFTPLAA